MTEEEAKARLIARLKKPLEEIFKAIHIEYLLTLAFNLNIDYNDPNINRDREKIIQGIFRLCERRSDALILILSWLFDDVLSKKQSEFIKLIKTIEPE